ncbi:hypothetical protein ACJJTC_004716 [Scirpophaga incertulas]
MQIAADLHLDHQEVIKDHRDFEVSRVKEACGNMRVIQVIQHRPMMNTKTEEKSEKEKELYRHVEVEQEAEEPMYTSEDNESKEKDDDDKCEENIRENQDDENIQGIEEYRTKSGRQDDHLDSNVSIAVKKMCSSSSGILSGISQNLEQSITKTFFLNGYLN